MQLISNIDESAGRSVLNLSQGASGRMGKQSGGGGAGDQHGGLHGGELRSKEEGFPSLQRPRIQTGQVGESGQRGVKDDLQSTLL